MTSAAMTVAGPPVIHETAIVAPGASIADNVTIEAMNAANGMTAITSPFHVSISRLHFTSPFHVSVFQGGQADEQDHNDKIF